MKNFFDFNLTGKKLFSVWILFYVLFLIPYISIGIKMSSIQPGSSPQPYILISLFALIIIAYLIMFYIARLVIQGVAYKDESVVFSGRCSKYAGKILVGFLLSAVTFGIYGPWFIKKMISFFVNESSYRTEKFEFNGSGGKLFLIVLLTLFVPVFLISFLLGDLSNNSAAIGSVSQILLLVTYLIIMPSYLYYVYKWMVNINYKGLNIHWETKPFNSVLKITLEIFLSIITIGIYTPMAVIKLYSYFVDHTFALSENNKKHFGYKKDNINDFLYFWGQILLTIVTLGLYHPWMLCNVSKRLINKTYLNE